MQALYPDPQSPSIELKADRFQEIVPMPAELAGQVSFHIAAKVAQSHLTPMTESAVPAGQIDVDTGFWTTDAPVFAWERVAWVGRSEHVRQRGWRLLPSALFPEGENIWTTRMSDTKKVNSGIEKWNKAGNPPDKKPRLLPNYTGSFGSRVKNCAAQGTMPNGKLADGMVFGGGQVSVVENCEFRKFAKIGLEIGRNSTRVNIRDVAIADCGQYGMKLTKTQSIDCGVRSILRTPGGILVDAANGTRIPSLATEHVDTVLTLRGRCEIFEATNLQIALTDTDIPVFDLSGLVSNGGQVRIQGGIRKVQNGGTAFYLDPKGERQILAKARGDAYVPFDLVF